MGEVWRAYDTETKRIVAIKVLPPYLADNNEFVRRFRREAEAAAQLNSPHVVPIHNYGEIDGRLYVDMRLIAGRDLGTVLTDGPLEPARAVRIIDQVAEALHAAHEIGLIHRDIKPSNILLDHNDFAYLIDFGIARAADETRLTKSGNTIGTFAYIAPERLDGSGKEDARVDIYSLACVLYECLTGEPPFDADTMPRLIVAHLNEPPPRPSISRPDVPAQVDEVIATGMAKDPNQRYATTIELADAAHDAITTPIPLSAQNQATRAAFVATPAAPTIPAADAHAPAADEHLNTTQQASTDPTPTETRTPTRKPWWPPRGRSALIAAIIVAVVVLVCGVIIFQLQQPSYPAPSAAPTTPAAPPPPPLPPPPKLVEGAELDGLLLSSDQINTAIGTTGIRLTEAKSTMESDDAMMSPAECLPLYSPFEEKVYAGSGWTAVRTRWFGTQVGEGVALFPSAHAAQAFVSASVPSWSACANSSFTDSYIPSAIGKFSVGPVALINGILSATKTQTNTKNWTCQRALTAVNNVVIETTACRSNLTDPATTLARQIAAKVPT